MSIVCFRETYLAGHTGDGRRSFVVGLDVEPVGPARTIRRRVTGWTTGAQERDIGGRGRSASARRHGPEEERERSERQKHGEEWSPAWWTRE